MGNDFLNKYEQKSEFVAPKQKPKKEVKPKNTKLIAGIGVGILLLLAIGMTVFFTMNSKTTLPNMEGWKEADTNLWASENSVMLRYTEAYSDEVAAGIVITHMPGEGETVEKGEFLEVQLSLGADPSVMVAVPDLMSMSQAEIEAWVSENHMTKVRITSQNSKTVEMGETISFTVNDSTVIGDEVRRDSPVYVIMSNGTGEDGNVTVPDFTMMTLEQAKTFATDNEIILEIEEVFDDAVAKEQIISQDIEMEEIVKIGDTIKLKVSLGPEILIPDFSGYEMDMAMTIASQNGITVMTEEVYSSSSEGRLISQSISAGTLYDTDDILKLKYSLGNTILIPSYIGQGVEAFQAWATEYNGMGTNITIKTTYTTSNDLPGTIITQDKADVMSGISTTVNVIVSKGKVVYVPDFVADSGAGYEEAVTREQAIAMCEEAGLVAIFQEEKNDKRLEGEVFSQSISAGKEVQQGTTITLKYKPVTSTIQVPNFVAMTADEILQGDYNKTFTLEYEIIQSYAGNGNVVQGQTPSSGTKVAPGTAVSLTFDMGESVPEPEENPDDSLEEISEEITEEITEKN